MLSSLSTEIKKSLVMGKVFPSRKVPHFLNFSSDVAINLVVVLPVFVLVNFGFHFVIAGVKAKRIFRSNGDELTDVRMIDDDDNLYISEGEGFALNDTLKTRQQPSPSVYSNPIIRQPAQSTVGLNPMHKCRISVIGPATVGKSALTIQYAKKYFLESYDNTIEDEFKTMVNIDGALCEVVILDTAGMEQFSALRNGWITNSEAIIMVFSVDNHSFLEEMDSFFLTYSIACPEKNKPLALVCNKIDLEPREITTEEGQKLAEKYKAKYFETSAKMNLYVEDVFNYMVRQLVALKTKNKPKAPRVEEERSFFSRCSLV